MNPRAAINDLLPFQGSPFSRLGTSPQAPKSTGYVRPVECIERRGWDSNPRALADKRFSRPPRYDHFDTPARERVMGIEPTYPAWKAGVLPLNYTRIGIFNLLYNAQFRNRTRDTRIFSPLLYQLS